MIYLISALNNYSCDGHDAVEKTPVCYAETIEDANNAIKLLEIRMAEEQALIKQNREDYLIWVMKNPHPQYNKDTPSSVVAEQVMKWRSKQREFLATKNTNVSFNEDTWFEYEELLKL